MSLFFTKAGLPVTLIHQLTILYPHRFTASRSALNKPQRTNRQTPHAGGRSHPPAVPGWCKTRRLDRNDGPVRHESSSQYDSMFPPKSNFSLEIQYV
jgi:hypothetical protein